MEAKEGVTEAEGGVPEPEAGYMEGEEGVMEAEGGVTEAKGGVMEAEAGNMEAEGGVMEPKGGVTEVEAGNMEAEGGVMEPHLEEAADYEGGITEAKEVAREMECMRASAFFPQQEAGELLSPGFRSAAALAGWDDEALMLAAINQSPAISTGSPNATNNGADFEVLPESPACRDQKRDKQMNRKGNSCGFLLCLGIYNVGTALFLVYAIFGYGSGNHQKLYEAERYWKASWSGVEGRTSRDDESWQNRLRRSGIMETRSARSPIPGSLLQNAS
ncbi:hypothetical protein R1flu_014546 [Riccia fluitans]|uniref:Uncharacterized protein n=1 Tax=Riccia fluitans TaxID=41844 RepID=A0ABD1YH49_9MARC